MQIKNLLLLLLMFCFISSLSAQKKKKKKKESNIEIIEFGEDGELDDNSTPLSGYVIKTSPTSYLFGSQFVEIEKYATDYLSIQAGLGLTFKPLAGELYANILDELDEDGGDDCDSEIWGQGDICDDYNDFSIRTYKPGFLISGSARLFFDDDSMDGGYFAMKLRYSTAKYQVQDIIQNAGSLERLEGTFVPESVKRFDIIGHYGYQTLYSKLTAEYFLGIGARIRNESRQDIGRNEFGLIQGQIRKFKKTGLRIEGGIRIGFQL